MHIAFIIFIVIKLDSIFRSGESPQLQSRHTYGARNFQQIKKAKGNKKQIGKAFKQKFCKNFKTMWL